MENAPQRFSIGEIQASALEIWVLDPIFDEPLSEDDQQPFPGRLLPGGGRSWLLEVDPGKAALAWRCLNEGSNGADANYEHNGQNPEDRSAAEALSSLAHRVGKTVADWRTA